MSPSIAPPFCSLTWTPRTVPLTRPQTVTSCAITLPSICAPLPIKSCEARNSPSIRPKICAGPVHSILPTIEMPEPMQEPVPAYWRPRNGLFNDRVLLLHHPSDDFGRIRCRVLILLGCLAFEPTQHVHLRFRRQRAWEDSQLRTPFENRTAQTRTATRMEPTIASHSAYGAVSGISRPNNSRIAPAIRTSLCHLPVRDCFVRENWDNCGAWGTQTSKKSSM